MVDSLDWKEGLTKKNKVCPYVRTRRGQKNMIDEKINLSEVWDCYQG